MERELELLNKTNSIINNDTDKNLSKKQQGVACTASDVNSGIDGYQDTNSSQNTTNNMFNDNDISWNKFSQSNNSLNTGTSIKPLTTGLTSNSTAAPYDSIWGY